MAEKILTAAEAAAMVNGTIIGDPNREIHGVASMREATPAHLSFVGNKRYVHQLDTSRAGVIIVSEDLANVPADERTLIVSDSVDAAFARIIAFFAPEPVQYRSGIHASAVIDPSARIGKDVHVGANAVIDAEAEIRDGAIIGAGCYVGVRAVIGEKTLLYPNVTVMHRCVVGKDCIFHPGVVIGGDGFGFQPGPRGLVKVPQTGIVEIGDDVEIGANSTVDRARFGKTVIKSNVKIDNQVMVAHNVEIGESSILVAQSGIAGSAILGRGVIMGAKSGINGHITIGDGTQIAGTSGVIKSLPPQSIVIGTPAESQRDFMARVALPKKMEKLLKRMEKLEEELQELRNK